MNQSNKKKILFPLWLKISLTIIIFYIIISSLLIYIISISTINSLSSDIYETYQIYSKKLSSDIETEIDESEKIISYFSSIDIYNKIFKEHDYSLLNNFRNEMINKCDSFIIIIFPENKSVIISNKISIDEFNKSSIYFSDKYLLQCIEKSKQGRSFLTQPYFNEITFEPVFIISYPIFVKEKVIGMIAMRYKLTNLWKMLDDISMQEGVSAYLVSEDRSIIAHSDLSQTGKKADNELVNSAFNNYSGVQEISIKNKKYIGAYYPINLRIKFALVIQQSTEIAYNKIKFFIIQSLTILLVSIVLVIIASIIFGKFFTRPVKYILNAIDALKKSIYTKKIKIISRDEFYIISENFNQMIDELKEKETITDMFGKYISSDIRDEVLKDKSFLDGQEKECTVLFSDIRGFTSFSEKHPPKIVLNILNNYFTEMINIVKDHHGIVNKFMGDALMVLFGIPVQKGNHALNAVLCAKRMFDRLEHVNNDFFETYQVKFMIGIGIATGKVIAGNIGTEDRKEYSVIGDIVNIASRLENLTKEYEAKIIFNKNTNEQIKDILLTASLGEINIRGKEKPLELFKLVKKSK